MSDLLETLLQQEHEGWTSLCDGSASSYYAANMIDGGKMILENGVTMDRDTVVSALEHAPPWKDYEINAPTLLELSNDAVALTYSGVGYRDSNDTFTAIMTSVYVRTDDGWKLGLYTQTPISSHHK